MKNGILIIIVLCSVISLTGGFLSAQTHIKKSPGSYIEKDCLRWQPLYMDVTPSKEVDSWKIPFGSADRNKLNSFKVISKFGDPRLTFLRNHIHPAIDIVPSKPEKFNTVYPVANGVVCSIHLGHPYKTVVIKHLLHDKSIIYTSYKHLQEIYVKNGMQVDQNTKLGRLYTHAEAQALKGNYDHLHFEVRKSFEDYGCASWLTMTKDELNKYFYNPLDFLKSHLVADNISAKGCK
jgi:murein DD-endopeptidase MepM/ murein hydrolase activator NlpD